MSSEQAAAGRIRLEDLTRSFGSGRTEATALSGVDLEIPPGELVVILGPSGSGKTTLLNLIGAIDRPTSGLVDVAGQDLGEMGDDDRAAFRRRHVGFIFQFFNLVPTLTALENVQLVAELCDRGGRVEAEAALREVDLTDHLHQFPASLSGGEQQRVAVARAVAKDPDLLLCDEPTGSLDLETGRRVLSLLRRLNREREATVLIVTHNAAIGEMADRVVSLHDGHVASDETNADPTDPDEVHW